MPEDRRLMPTPATEHTYKCIWVNSSQLPLKAQEPVVVPWKRNDLLVNFPLLEERGYSLSFSINEPQPDFSRGIETYVPSPQGEHATETDAFLRTDQLNRISPRGSALPSPADQETHPMPLWLNRICNKRVGFNRFWRDEHLQVFSYYLHSDHNIYQNPHVVQKYCKIEIQRPYVMSFRCCSCKELPDHAMSCLNTPSFL